MHQAKAWLWCGNSFARVASHAAPFCPACSYIKITSCLSHHTRTDLLSVQSDFGICLLTPSQAEQNISLSLSMLFLLVLNQACLESEKPETELNFSFTFLIGECTCFPPGPSLSTSKQDKPTKYKK